MKTSLRKPQRGRSSTHGIFGRSNPFRSKAKLDDEKQNQMTNNKVKKQKTILLIYTTLWISLLFRRVQKIKQIEPDHCDRYQNNCTKKCNRMALVSYIGIDRNLSEISIIVTVYLVKISTVLGGVWDEPNIELKCALPLMFLASESFHNHGGQK